MPPFLLRDSEQRSDLREYDFQCATFAQLLEKHARVSYRQRRLCLLPNTIGDQRVGLPIRDDAPHQVRCLDGDSKAQLVKSCREFRDPENPNRVFDKRVRHMSKYTFADIAHAIERVDEFAVGIFCDGVDRQVASAQIVFERDFR